MSTIAEKVAEKIFKETITLFKDADGEPDAAIHYERAEAFIQGAIDDAVSEDRKVRETASPDMEEALRGAIDEIQGLLDASDLAMAAKKFNTREIYGEPYAELEDLIKLFKSILAEIDGKEKTG